MACAADLTEHPIAANPSQCSVRVMPHREGRLPELVRRQWSDLARVPPGTGAKPRNARRARPSGGRWAGCVCWLAGSRLELEPSLSGSLKGCGAAGLIPSAAAVLADEVPSTRTLAWICLTFSEPRHCKEGIEGDHPAPPCSSSNGG